MLVAVVPPSSLYMAKNIYNFHLVRYQHGMASPKWAILDRVLSGHAVVTGRVYSMKTSVLTAGA